jgi:probable blue pigment (indigoidine) exporter
VFNFGLFFPLLSVAVYRLPGGVAAAVGGLQPLLVVLLSRVLAGRTPRRQELVIGCIAVCGVALVAIHPGAGLDSIGLLAAVGANVSFAIGVVLTKRYSTPSNRIAATGWQLVIGGVVLAPLTLALEGMPPALTGRNMAGFMYLSLVGTAVAFIVWFNGIRRLPAASPPLLGLAAPVTGAVLGWVVLDQSLSALQIVGFAITIGAIAYGGLLGSRSAALLDVGPLVAQTNGAMEQQRCSRIVGEVAEPLELHHRAQRRVGQRRLDLGTGQQCA